MLFYFPIASSNPLFRASRNLNLWCKYVTAKPGLERSIIPSHSPGKMVGICKVN